MSNPRRTAEMVVSPIIQQSSDITTSSPQNNIPIQNCQPK